MSGVDMVAIRARYKRACEELDRMTTALGGPGTAWRWSIPVNPERDSDLLLADSLADVGDLLDALDRVKAASEGVDMLVAQAERRGAVKALRWFRNRFNSFDSDYDNAIVMAIADEDADAIENGSSFDPAV